MISWKNSIRRIEESRTESYYSGVEILVNQKYLDISKNIRYPLLFAFLPSSSKLLWERQVSALGFNFGISKKLPDRVASAKINPLIIGSILFYYNSYKFAWNSGSIDYFFLHKFRKNHKTKGSSRQGYRSIKNAHYISVLFFGNEWKNIKGGAS